MTSKRTSVSAAHQDAEDVGLPAQCRAIMRGSDEQHWSGTWSIMFPCLVDGAAAVAGSKWSWRRLGGTS